MLRKGLAIALAGVLSSSVPVSADSLLPSADRVARLAAQQGPIRQHLEVAFASPLAGRAAEALGVDLQETRHQVTGGTVRPPTFRQTLLLVGLLMVVAFIMLSRIET